jgi:hypothetical protein
MEGVADSLAVGQSWKGDQRVILFIKLAPRYRLTDDLKDNIRRTLRDQASPRHVPALVLETPEAPYTFNMKKVEIAVTNIINGKPVINRDALANPESIDYFEKAVWHCTAHYNQALNGSTAFVGVQRKPRADTKKFCTAKLERGFPSNEEA